MPEDRNDTLLLILTYFCYFKTDLMKFETNKCVFAEICKNWGGGDFYSFVGQVSDEY